MRLLRARCDPGLLARLGARELARVDVGHDRDPHVGVLGRPGGGGRDPVQLLVAGQLEERGLLPAGGELHHREPALAQHLLVHRLHQHLGGRGRLDHAHVARLDPGRVAHQDLGQRLGALVSHDGTPARSSSQRCRLRSPVSSGWKATARILPCRTATGCRSISASTSTSSPWSSTQGARMKTARSGPRPSRSRSASKLFSWRPKALRRGAHVQEAQVVAVEHDQAGAGSEHRAPAPHEVTQGLGQTLALDPHRDRGRFAAGNHQAVEPLELGRGTDHARLGARPPPARGRAPRSRPGWRARR